MVRRLAVLVAALLMLAATNLVSAQAATVIYYSKAEGSYGWCAGYSYSKGETCARDSCKEYGGTDCGLAVECDSGWSATAVAEAPADGFGTTCGWAQSVGARGWALIVCMLASNTFCHLDQTFDSGGNERTERENHSVEQIWMAQFLLDLNDSAAGKYDGVMGPKTTAAVRAFQAKLGLAQTGTVDDVLLGHLRDGIGGAPSLMAVLKSNFFGPVPKDTFSYAATPRPDRDLGQEIVLQTQAQRKMTLASMLASASNACTLPAQDVAVVSGTKFANWYITCAEGPYRLTIKGPGQWSIDKFTAASGSN